MSLAKRIIPCLDIRDGRVVKGVRFVNIRDAGDPVEVAENYDAEGADELALLDITASSEGRGTTLRTVEKIAERVFIPLTVGGGVRTASDVQALLDVGADKVAVNSAAIQNPDLIHDLSARFGSQCIVVAIDAKKNDAGAWSVFTHGGRKKTEIDAVSWARKMTENDGAGEVLLTSMDCDGVKCGFDIALTRAVADAAPVPVIASGGVGHPRHFSAGILEGGADAVLAASIFHFDEYSIRAVKADMRKNGIEVRL